MVPFAIAGVQMPVSAAHQNVTAMGQRLDLLLGRFPWVQMAVFSELAPFGPLLSHAQILPGPTEHAFQEMAARRRVWLIPGSMFERVGDRVYNTALAIDPRGEVVARYRKMFPFRPHEQGVEGGTEFCAFDVPGVGRFGVSICYDIWFPETTRSLVSQGVEVLLHPTLTGTVDRDVELAIVRATAAMFQCYVIDVNGLSDGGVGRSCIVDPAGTLLHQAGGQEELFPIEVDLRAVRRQREVGLHGLGQPLKSFRDRSVEFPVYDRASGADAYLHTLGPLEMPKRGSRAGLDAPPPGQRTATAAPLVERPAAPDLVAARAPLPDMEPL